MEKHKERCLKTFLVLSNSIWWKYNVVIAGIRVILVVGLFYAVISYIDFEALGICAELS